jgi:23S rRNA (guanosine2251-2'-O)-methyltransferase
MIQDPSTIIFSAHSICEVIKNNRRRIERIFTTKQETKAFRQIKGVLPAGRIPVSFVDKAFLTKLAGTPDHQGVVASVAPFSFRKKMFNSERESFLLLLDNIQDPRNLGAILRSAYCTGVQGVLLSGKQTAPLSGTVHRASAGLVERLEIVREATSLEAAKKLVAAGYTLYAGALGGKSITDVSLRLPCAVVIGNEGDGISPEILRISTSVLLPQVTADVSYNASVAAGILLFLCATKHKII